MSEYPFLGRWIKIPLYDGSVSYLDADGNPHRAYPEAVFEFREVRPARVPDDALVVGDQHVSARSSDQQSVSEE